MYFFDKRFINIKKYKYIDINRDTVSSVSGVSESIENIKFLNVTVAHFKRDKKGRYKNTVENERLEQARKRAAIYDMKIVTDRAMPLHYHLKSATNGTTDIMTLEEVEQWLDGMDGSTLRRSIITLLDKADERKLQLIQRYVSALTGERVKRYE